MKPEMFGSNSFLRIDDLIGVTEITIASEGKETTSNKFVYPEVTQKGTPHPFKGQPKKEFHIEVELPSGEKKTIRLNKTSYDNVSRELGADTADWVSVKVPVAIFPLPNGKKMIVLGNSL